MPILPLGDWENEPAEATLVLWSVMLYPHRPKQRQEWYATNLAETLAESQEWFQNHSHLVTPELVQILLRTPPIEKIRESSTQALDRGSMAGDVLLFIKMLLTHGLEASVDKAVYLVVAFGRLASVMGVQLPKNRQSVWDAWRDYQSVAHLWAAYNLGHHYNPPEWVTLRSFTSLAAFLARAEFFRQFGTHHVSNPKYRKNPGPILPPENTWMVPEQFPLPSVAVEEEIPPIPDWMPDFLRQYHAQQRQYRAP